MAEYRVEEAGLSFTINTKYYNQLDIEAFSHMMKDPSYCYKFYWLSNCAIDFGRCNGNDL